MGFCALERHRSAKYYIEHEVAAVDQTSKICMMTEESNKKLKTQSTTSIVMTMMMVILCFKKVQ
jgi:hypothetical protein